MAIWQEKEKIAAFWDDPIIQEDVATLKGLLQKKSIFAQQIGLTDVALTIKEVFEVAGADVLVDDSYAAPFVLAEFRSSNPEAQTLIFYNHYDTVPADSDQLWEKGQPFDLTITENTMYGRGVDDDKGHIMARLSAVKKYLAKHGSLPVNIIFIMEGAEESASVDLDKYLAKYRDRLVGADLLVWEQGIRNQKDQLEIHGGNKGIVTFDLSVKSADLDIHSSLGGVIESATWYLVNALHTLRDKDGRLAIPSLYENLREPSQREWDLIEEYALNNEEDLREIYGLTLPSLAKDRKDLLRRLYFEPAITIEGISSGYQGPGVKTIVPAQALAKMEVRLVPGLEADVVLDAIRQHLKDKRFGQVEVTFTLTTGSYRSDLSVPAISRLVDVAKHHYPAGVSLLPTSPGTGPMHTVFSALGVPIAGFGLGHAQSRDHAGDENVKIADYVTHIALVEEFIGSYVERNY